MSRSTTIPGGKAIAIDAAVIRGVRWIISPDALRMYAPAMLNGHAAQVSVAELVITIRSGEGRPRASLLLMYGASERTEHELPLPDSRIAIIREETGGGGEGGAMEHIDIPGVLSLTLRRSQGELPRLIYAGSPLLAAIGLPGGVYDVPELL